jgi:hypothetical protein
MRKLWNYLVQHVREDFHPGYYSAVLFFLAVCITFNFAYDIEDSHIDTLPGILRVMAFFVAQGIAYYVPVYLAVRFKPGLFKLTRMFWLRSAFALALLSLERSNLLIDPLLSGLDYALQFYAHKVLNNLSGILVVILPLYVFYRIYDRKYKNFYGFGVLPAERKPYAVLLALVIPLLAVASFNKGFQNQYPMYVETHAYSLLGVPQWLTVVLYELAYGLNFVSIEFLYRGFFILGMASILGRSSILPMACLYCFLHFGKPAPEAISSIFGGYILGVVSYETKSIWGGIFIHIGIAWTMELLAFFQKM